MAFNHPHKLDIKRTHKHEGEKFSDVPYIRDRRGRIVYRWDAFYSDCSNTFDQRKRNIWDLVECLDERRKRRQLAKAGIARKEKVRLDRLENAEEFSHHEVMP